MGDKANQPLMQDTVPRIDVEKGKSKADSYIAATDRSSAEPEAAYRKTVEPDNVEVVVPPQFVGLTKDELEKYRNDPFWRRLRMFLFVLFWLAWIAMFAVAILIVVFSPKCPPRNIPEWWQRKVCYQAWTHSFQDSNGDGVGDLAGFSDRLDNLRRIGIQTIRPTPLLATVSHSGYDVTDYSKVDPHLGNNEDLIALISNTHYNDMYFVMDLPLTTTSTEHEWFKKSAAGEEADYADYYYWKSELDDSLDTTAWTKPEGADKYYFHQESHPDHAVLNWGTKKVQEDLLKVVRQYLEFGVDGFYLPLPQFFKRNSDFKLPNWSEAAQKVKMIREVVDNYQKEVSRETPYLLYVNTPDKNLANSNKRDFIENSGINYMINEHLTEISNDTCPGKGAMAKCVHNGLSAAMAEHDAYNTTWPMWEIGTEHVSRVNTRMSKYGELMVMLELMLPGSLNFYYGDEIGMTDLTKEAIADFGMPLRNPKDMYRSPMQWSGEEKNAGYSTADELPIPVNTDYKTINFETQYYQWLTSVKMFRRLAKLRQNDEVLMRGAFQLGEGDVAATDKLLTFSRFDKPIQRGASIYVGALNFDSEDHEVVFDENVLPLNEADRAAAMVITITSTLGEAGKYWPRKAIDLSKDAETKLILGPMQGIIIRLNAKESGAVQTED